MTSSRSSGLLHRVEGAGVDLWPFPPGFVHFKLVNETPRDGAPLTAQDFDNHFLLLVVAGNETTPHTITQSMLAPLPHPEQLARLQEDPSLIPTAVEECLR